MRHRNKGRKFSMEKPQRTALFKALERSLIEHKSITTTEARAKELRRYIERLITTAKTGKASIMNTRRLLKKRHDDATIAKIFELAKTYEGRSGGYTKVLKVAPRKSDSTKMAVIQLIS